MRCAMVAVLYSATDLENSGRNVVNGLKVNLSIISLINASVPAPCWDRAWQLLAPLELECHK